MIWDSNKVIIIIIIIIIIMQDLFKVVRRMFYMLGWISSVLKFLRACALKFYARK